MEKEIYIFGAHSRSRTLGIYLTTLYNDTRILAYLVDNDEENPDEIDGVPIIHLKKGIEIREDVPIYLGTRSVFHADIISRLHQLTGGSIVSVTPELDIELRNQYVKMVFEQKGWSFVKFDDLPQIGSTDTALAEGKQRARVYVAKSVYDTPLMGNYEIQSWERMLQVGCDNSDQQLSDCIYYDNVGEHISMHNKQFCELTGLYWIWKNAGEDILGLCHYRRHFLLGNDWQLTMQYHGIDVILPVPLYVAPSLGENYRMRHTKCTWNAMMSVLRKNPCEFDIAQKFFEENGCYSPCNMLIARKQVLQDLCAWLFPILFEVVSQIGVLEDAYQNRYPGFLAERLISFYFYEHSDKYKVVYADKNFLR